MVLDLKGLDEKTFVLQDTQPRQGGWPCETD